ncbi:hypothetical protein SAMN05444004_102227 [Jannaschia faecimaris]|uniref:DUF2726 domain-containing protein n=1 Tax=Jannaschia faecimaris TaxID=1244108 RepID=A0A1H3LK86_9RHOB|nr:hypothetical protein [Jannaschia faecimaris]SDY64559.1 hypothetical protein SAMN05444004_102227 [Jannaschia faecimaris]
MQLDRLMAKAMTRITKTGIAALRDTSESANEGTAKRKAMPHGLRGSGSWANEWVGARAAVARAKAVASPGKFRAEEINRAVDQIAEGTIRARPLMSKRDVQLHNWLLDRMEAEAPCCTLHVGVALQAFLVASTAYEGHDPLNGLFVDMLIVDEHGQPAAALIRENAPNPAKQLLLIDALMDADVPIIDIPPRPSLAVLWEAVAATLPKT